MQKLQIKLLGRLKHLTHCQSWAAVMIPNAGFLKQVSKLTLPRFTTCRIAEPLSLERTMGGPQTAWLCPVRSWKLPVTKIPQLSILGNRKHFFSSWFAEIVSIDLTSINQSGGNSSSSYINAWKQACLKRERWCWAMVVQVCKAYKKDSTTLVTLICTTSGQFCLKEMYI